MMDDQRATVPSVLKSCHLRRRPGATDLQLLTMQYLLRTTLFTVFQISISYYELLSFSWSFHDTIQLIKSEHVQLLVYVQLIILYLRFSYDISNTNFRCNISQEKSIDNKFSMFVMRPNAVVIVQTVGSVNPYGNISLQHYQFIFYNFWF